MVLKSCKVVGKVVVKVLRVVGIGCKTRILRGLRLAARLKLSLSEEIEIAVHKLPLSIMKLDKSRLMMEVNYMLSYGAAEPSLSLLQRYNILGMLLPFHAAHLAQQSNKQLSESSVMLMIFRLIRTTSRKQCPGSQVPMLWFDMPLDFLDLSSPDASNAQVVRGKILSNFSGPSHASVHEKDQCGGPNLIGGCHNSTGSRLK
ncbi:hypothetical protein T459_30975 [Capsicum annuum]|uniref:tRNA nucleotidyltransferase/poly(A) polymerase RNA and SrmB- binding domain-containing protein n=1 Tax=Capsicum annuum TaxID=4072 RepID=A0A2G2Y9Y9_CAPAN|nr:hypothetical protein T459_30975 [Capsicum annuum]